LWPRDGSRRPPSACLCGGKHALATSGGVHTLVRASTFSELARSPCRTVVQNKMLVPDSTLMIGENGSRLRARSWSAIPSSKYPCHNR
jgi:hypothetical protein